LITKQLSVKSGVVGLPRL